MVHYKVHNLVIMCAESHSASVDCFFGLVILFNTAFREHVCPLFSTICPYCTYFCSALKKEKQYHYYKE